MTELEIRAETAKAEAERLAKRRARFENQAQRLKSYVISVMEDNRLETLEGNHSTLALRKNPVAVQIENAELIPPQFMREIPPSPARLEPDRAAVKLAYQRHQCVPGAKLTQGLRLERK